MGYDTGSKRMAVWLKGDSVYAGLLYVSDYKENNDFFLVEDYFLGEESVDDKKELKADLISKAAEISEKTNLKLVLKWREE